MTEVEKLYSLAGVEPINFAKQGAIDFTNTIEIDEKRYPDFTAEKQIELIKWLGEFFVHIDKRENQIIISCGDGYVSYTAEKIEDAISLLINSKWNTFTKEEQEQIREILK